MDVLFSSMAILEANVSNMVELQDGKSLIPESNVEGCPPCHTSDRHILQICSVNNILELFVIQELSLLQLTPKLASKFVFCHIKYPKIFGTCLVVIASKQ